MYQGWSVAIQGNEYHPHLHLGVVATEKGAFGSPSTTVAYFTSFILYTNKNIRWKSTELNRDPMKNNIKSN